MAWRIAVGLGFLAVLAVSGWQRWCGWEWPTTVFMLGLLLGDRLLVWLEKFDELTYKDAKAKRALQKPPAGKNRTPAPQEVR